MLKPMAHYCTMQADQEVLLNTEGLIDEGRLSNQNSNPNLISSVSVSVAQFPGMLHLIHKFCLSVFLESVLFFVMLCFISECS